MGLHFPNSETLCEYAVEHTGDSVLLAFSRGKDSTGAWLQLRRYFKKIVPVHLYRIPDIEFVEKNTRYFEEFFGTPIINMPHPALYRTLKNLVFQDPAHAFYLIEEDEYTKLEFDYDDVFDIVKRDQGMPVTALTATGVRASDSIIRHTSIKTNGSLNEKRKTFFPIYDWNKDRLIKEIRDSGVKLAPEYCLFGRSFDGLDYRFVKPVSDLYPQDFERMKEFYPLIEAEIKRMEFRRDHVER